MTTPLAKTYQYVVSRDTFSRSSRWALIRSDGRILGFYFTKEEAEKVKEQIEVDPKP